jgi:hypothetical protein
MYVRMAHFEGGTTADIMAEVEEIRSGLRGGGTGGGGYFPRELTDRVRRAEMHVDREHGRVAILLYCESEADAREVDRIMDGMSPQREGWGTRVSSDVFEVVLDETVRQRKAA